MRKTGTLAICAALCLAGSAAFAAEFHFTATADPRNLHDAFGGTLAAIKSNLGDAGVFHVSPGDIDGTPAENRVQVNTNLDNSFLWYPGTGNHEAEDADMDWIRAEYDSGNGVRTPLKNFTLQNGPAGSVQSTYSWNHGNAHFVMLNEYWNGGTAAGSDVATNGDVVPALRNWLDNDLAGNTRPAVFVFGHEPAYPFNRHVGDSLDAHLENRDAFWGLLESYNVDAYICGHTHVYSKYQKTADGTWQIDLGNAGNDTDANGYTFLDVTVSDTAVTFDVWRDLDGAGSGGFSKFDSWTTTIPEPATLALVGMGVVGLFGYVRRQRKK